MKLLCTSSSMQNIPIEKLVNATIKPIHPVVKTTNTSNPKKINLVNLLYFIRWRFLIISLENFNVKIEAIPTVIAMRKIIIKSGFKVRLKFKLWIATLVPERGLPIVQRAIIEKIEFAVVIPPMEIIKSLRLFFNLASSWLITVTWLAPTPGKIPENNPEKTERKELFLLDVSSRLISTSCSGISFCDLVKNKVERPKRPAKVGKKTEVEDRGSLKIKSPNAEENKKTSSAEDLFCFWV